MKPAYNFRWDNDVQEQISRLRDCRRFPTWCECQQTGTVAQVMLILGFFIKFQSWWTYLMSGTLRLRVHSWELTNESEEIIDRIISIQHRTHFAINIQCPVSSQSNWGLFDLLLSTNAKKTTFEKNTDVPSSDHWWSLEGYRFPRKIRRAIQIDTTKNSWGHHRSPQ